MSDYSELTVLIPVKNEANNIRQLIGTLVKTYPNLSIIVADDGSEDGSADIIQDICNLNENITFLDRKDKEIKGLTVSVLDSIDLVKTKYFIVMDGDGQHPTECLAEIYSQLLKGKAVCVASRSSVPGWRWDRKLISKIGSFLAKGILYLRGKKVPADVLSGFFGIETSFWNKVTQGKKKRFCPKGYKILFDFLKLCDSSLSLGNVYFVFNERSSGSSKIGLKIYTEFLKALFK